jgi:predicted membrane channel-forming protein YqfA (hemolysin III family)
MKSLFVSTPGGKAGAIDGLNLFFGALLGANLGTLEHLSLFEYVKLILLLAATVMTLRMVSTSERRVYMLVVLGAYALLLAGMATLPALHPKGLALDDLYRLIATLAVWVFFVLGTELSPVSAAPSPGPEDQANAS